MNPSISSKPEPTLKDPAARKLLAQLRGAHFYDADLKSAHEGIFYAATARATLPSLSAEDREVMTVEGIADWDKRLLSSGKSLQLHATTVSVVPATAVAVLAPTPVAAVPAVPRQPSQRSLYPGAIRCIAGTAYGRS